MERFDLVLNDSAIDCLPFLTGCNAQVYRMVSSSSIVKQVESDGLIACDLPLDSFMYFFRDNSDLFQFWSNYIIDFTVRLWLNDYTPYSGLEIPLIMFCQSNGSAESTGFIFGIYFIDSSSFKFFYGYRFYYGGPITKVYSNDSHSVIFLNVPNRFIISHNGNFVLYWNETLMDFTFSGTYPGYNPYVFGYKGYLRFGTDVNISSTASLRYFSFSMFPSYGSSTSTIDDKVNSLYDFLEANVECTGGVHDYTKMFPWVIGSGETARTVYLTEQLRQVLCYNYGGLV